MSQSQTSPNQPAAPTIVALTFTDPPPMGPFTGWRRTVTATLSDGSSVVLFSYYPDELAFTESELVGLTTQAAHVLFHQKDVAYLQS